MEEIGTVSVGKSKFLQPMYVYNCVRKPGYVYDFTKKRGDYYQCVQCRKLARTRTIVIRDDTVVAGAKHPEDDHHPACQPRPQTGTFGIIMNSRKKWLPPDTEINFGVRGLVLYTFLFAVLLTVVVARGLRRVKCFFA